MDLTRKDVDSTTKQILESAPVSGQAKSHPHFERAPLVTEVPDQGFVLATVGGTHYIYTKIGGVMHKAALTAA